MNHRLARTVVFLIVAAVVLLVSGCKKSMSPGPAALPKPQSASGTVSPTQEGMPTSVVGTAVAEASATAQATQPAQATAVPPTATQPPAPQPTATPAPSGGILASYTVKPGDRFFSIGREFGVNPYAIAQANHIGPPYTIYPGQVLAIPSGGASWPSPTPGAGPTTYTVKSGDTVYSIARKFGKSAAEIINANNLANPNFIFPGQVIQIP